MNTQTELTMVGPSKSGKTVLLSALFHNEATSHDLTIKQADSSDEKPPLSLLFHISDDENEDDDEDRQTSEGIQDINFSVQRAKDHDSTDKKYSFHAMMNWQDESGEDFARTPGEARFKLWDAPGGLFTENLNAISIDEDTREQREEYRELFYKSRGTVICLSSDPGEFDKAQMARLNKEIHRARARKMEAPSQGLERIAVCFTKIEKRLLNNGSLAYRDLLNAKPDILPIDAYEHTITALHGFKDHFKEDVKIQVFPVSTYGFVGGTGAANFYPHPKRPGLLTRSIGDDELCNPDETRRARWRDHYPHEINDAVSGNLWQPFNLMPPFFFAATGRATGPKNFTIEEVYKRHCELREGRHQF